MSQREGATLFMSLLAAFAALLLALQPTRGFRHRHAPWLIDPNRVLEGLIGCFANTLALHLDVVWSTETLRTLLDRVRESLFGSLYSPGSSL